MKILLEIWQVVLAGAEHVLVDLAQFYKEKGNDVFVVVLTNKKKNKYTDILDEKGIRTYYYEGKQKSIGGKINRYLFLNNIIKKINPDVVHGHLDYKYLWAYSILHKRRIIETIHSEAYRLDNGQFRILYSFLKKKKLIVPVCPTDRGAKEFAERFGTKKESIKVIPNPVDLDKFRGGDNRDNKKKELTFCFAARFHSIKNHRMLLLAFKLYCEKQEKGVLLLAGEGETKADMQQLARELDIEKRVVFLGEVEDIAALLRKIDVGVISSDSESFSLFLVECMAAGLPIISTEVGEAYNAITDNGIVVKKGDYTMMAEAMLEMAEFKEKRYKMGMNSLAKVKKYGIEAVGDEYLKLYTEIV